MNPTNQNTPSDFTGQSVVKFQFPGTKFVPDVDPESKQPVLDEKTQEWKSGTLIVTLYESVKVPGASPSIREVSSVRKPMSLVKYRATREDIDRMNTEELKEYFPELTKEVTKAVKIEKSPEVVALEEQVENSNKQVEELKKLLEKALAAQNSTDKSEDKKKTVEKEQKSTESPKE